MISFDIEPLSKVRQDIDPLIRLHYEEIALDRDKIPLDPDWESYAQMEKIGNLLIVTARLNQELIGYAFWLIRNHLHYKQTKWAYNDVIFLKKEHRNAGTGGNLIRICEQILTELRVDKISWHLKVAHDWSKILERMGYQKEDIILGKYIGE